MNENEFEHDGKVYVAFGRRSCDGCAFHDKPHEYCSTLPVACLPQKRADGEIVIFKEKQP